MSTVPMRRRGLTWAVRFEHERVEAIRARVEVCRKARREAEMAGGRRPAVRYAGDWLDDLVYFLGRIPPGRV
jgi:hypothetical protein